MSTRQLDVFVITDMILAIAIIAVTPGAIAEFQLRVGNIRSAANSAAVVVRRFRGCYCGLIGPGGGEGDNGRLLFGGLLLFPLKQPGCVDPPRHGEYICHILAEEQEVVQQGHQREQTVRKSSGDNGIIDYIEKSDSQINQGKDPSLYRDDKQKQELCTGVQGGVGDK